MSVAILNNVVYLAKFNRSVIELIWSYVNELLNYVSACELILQGTGALVGVIL